MLEGDVEINNQWRNETEAFVTICLGSTSNDIQEEGKLITYWLICYYYLLHSHAPMHLML